MSTTSPDLCRAERQPLLDSLARLAADLCDAHGVRLDARHGDAESAVARWPAGHDLPVDTPQASRPLSMPLQAAARLVGTWHLWLPADRVPDARQAERLRALADHAAQVLALREPSAAAGADQYRRIVEEQAEMISLARPDGTLIYVNAAYGRCFGCDPAELIGTNLFDMVVPADRDAVRQHIDQVMRTGALLHGENRLQRADGTECWLSWINSRQQDSQGQPMLQSVGRDITEHKAAELALRASQSLLARTGRVAGIGGWELDLDRGILTWSDETRRIHGVPVDYVPALEHAIEFYAPAARPLIEQAVQRCMTTGRPYDLELPFVTADGRAITVRAVGEAEYEDGRVVRLVGAFQDVTERKALERRLLELNAVLDRSADLIVQTDRHGRVTYLNPACRKVLGMAPDDPSTLRNFADFNTPETNRLFGAVILPAVRAHGSWVGETTVVVAGNRTLPVSHLVIGHRDEHGRIARYSAVMRDITEQVEARRQLQQQTATLLSVCQSIPAMVAVVGADGRYRFVNEAFERWAGASRAQIVGRPVHEVLGRTDHLRCQPWIERALAGEAVQFEREYDTAGQHRLFSVSYIPLHADGGGVDGFVGVLNDISRQRQEETRLLQLSQLDSLTGLLNRAGLLDLLGGQLRRGDGARLALLYIDLDRFKPVNDEHGHLVGDEVLKEFAARLRRRVRPSDAVARLGGDEFVVLLGGVRTMQDAQAVATAVVAQAREPYQIGHLRLHVGASVGVALGATAEGGPADLLARADAMLFVAKHEGRGTHASEPQARSAQTQPDSTVVPRITTTL